MSRGCLIRITRCLLRRRRSSDKSAMPLGNTHTLKLQRIDSRAMDAEQGDVPVPSLNELAIPGHGHRPLGRMAWSLIVSRIYLDGGKTECHLRHRIMLRSVTPVIVAREHEMTATLLRRPTPEEHHHRPSNPLAQPLMAQVMHLNRSRVRRRLIKV